jgi:integrase
MYNDGHGLYLRIAEDGGRHWILRYVLNGKQRYMGLGPASLVTLAMARKRADEARLLKLDGIDPVDAKAAKRAEARADGARSITFKDAAERYIKAHKAGWKNAKHGAQWTATLEAYAYPHIGSLDVRAIDTVHVLKILEPIWATKPETAGRVRGRVKSVLDWATARGHRKGDNPARWDGHLDMLLPARGKVRKVQHHPALPYAEIGDFMAALRKQPGDAAQALDLLILTATRTGEIIAATWSEIDLKRKLWIIPPERMKADAEHRIPLSPQAVAILDARWKARQALPEAERSAWVFPGPRGKHLSNGGMLALLRRMARDDITPHGFRSTFRDWASEQTAFPPHVAEMALAHTIGDKVEAAYRRGDLFEKRKRLMDAWAGYCSTPSAKGSNVSSISEARAKK